MPGVPAGSLSAGSYETDVEAWIALKTAIEAAEREPRSSHRSVDGCHPTLDLSVWQ